MKKKNVTTKPIDGKNARCTGPQIKCLQADVYRIFGRRNVKGQQTPELKAAREKLQRLSIAEEDQRDVVRKLEKPENQRQARIKKEMRRDRDACMRAIHFKPAVVALAIVEAFIAKYEELFSPENDY